MRIARLGVVGLAALAAACGGDEKPAQYRVGGTVTGLSGGGLGLQLNGIESLTREADGPFTFQQQLSDKSDYTVTVSTQPPEQDCTVEGGTGKVAGADVTSVQVRCATKTYTVGGTLEGVRGTLVLGLDGGEQLSLTQAGRFTFTTKRPKGSAYTVSVVTTAQGQRCTVTNGSGTVAGNVEGVSVRCLDHFELVSTQAATGVLGQQGFTTGLPDQGDTAGANTLNGPYGNPVFVGDRLYVPDQRSHRVLGFTGVPTTNGASATFVLGQANFTDTATGLGATGLDSPAGLSSDGTRLAVVDYGNNRVLLHSALPTSTGSAATRVLGQANFQASASTCDQRTLNLPEGVFLGHGKVLVADSAHNRILVWNSVPTTDGAPADLVLGQRSFTTCAANDAAGDGTSDAAPSASTLFNPTGVWTDGTRLVVVDSANNRVLVWNQFPTANGQSADLVLGQAGFTSRATATTASGLRIPSAVTSTGLQLFVADSQNNRVLVWNQFPTANGQSADLVLGQPNLTTSTAASPPSASGLNQPSGLFLAWPQVGVSDSGNNRVLLYTSR